VEKYIEDDEVEYNATANFLIISQRRRNSLGFQTLEKEKEGSRKTN
jgi:hypothetical protein